MSELNIHSDSYKGCLFPQTEHGHATQCIAALQIPEANPGEQEQPSEAQSQDFGVSV